MSDNMDRSKSPTAVDWVELRRDIGSSPIIENVESFPQKFIRKFKESPLIPIGCAMTVGCLAFGLYFVRKGDSRNSQLMMRARILAQGFTILVFVTSFLSSSSNS